MFYVRGRVLHVSVAERLARLSAVSEDPGSNHASDSCVYHDSCCDMQPRAEMRTFTAVPRPTQPSTLRGNVK